MKPPSDRDLAFLPSVEKGCTRDAELVSTGPRRITYCLEH
jgi:hypothetical protein